MVYNVIEEKRPGKGNAENEVMYVFCPAYGSIYSQRE
jgi:hypothetical protein